MHTISTVNIETVSKSICNVCGHEVRCSWDANGCHANLDDLRAIRDAGHANWSKEEIDDIAYHVETRMDETYTTNDKELDAIVDAVHAKKNEQVLETILDVDASLKSYRIAYLLESGEWHVSDTFEAFDDAEANAYAEKYYAGSDWYVLNAAGKNINGGIDG